MYTHDEICTHVQDMLGDMSFATAAKRLLENRVNMHKDLTCRCEDLYAEDVPTCAHATAHCPWRYADEDVEVCDIMSGYVQQILSDKTLTFARLDELARLCGKNPCFVFDTTLNGPYVGPVCAPGIAKRVRAALKYMHPQKSMRQILIWYAEQVGIRVRTARKHLTEGVVDIVAFANEVEKTGIRFTDVMLPGNDRK